MLGSRTPTWHGRIQVTVLHSVFPGIPGRRTYLTTTTTLQSTNQLVQLTERQRSVNSVNFDNFIGGGIDKFISSKVLIFLSDNFIKVRPSDKFGGK